VETKSNNVYNFVGIEKWVARISLFTYFLSLCMWSLCAFLWVSHIQYFYAFALVCGNAIRNQFYSYRRNNMCFKNYLP
jgi:hypothetical protein